MTIDHELRQLIREATQLAIRDELPIILREQLKQFAEAREGTAATAATVRGNPALSTDEAGEYAGISPGTIRAKVASGELRAVRVGRVIKIRRTDLDAFLARSGARADGVIDLTARAHEILASTRSSHD
jgi:excisionase family DNA binding protein